MKGSQVGWTEVILNAVGYYSHFDPSPMLVIQPTVEMAEGWSKERLAPMIRDTRVLSETFPDPKSRDSGNTLRHKDFPGGYIAIIGANAPAGLAMRPIRVVLADETDRYPLSAGQGERSEGDPLKLAEKRQATFWNRKRLKGSTPTVKGLSVIERDYGRSDMRRFYVPCPHCAEFQTLEWRQVKWDRENGDGEHKPETAHYLCEACGVLWTDSERWAAVSKGEWRATRPFAGIAGFHLSQLYSPWVKLSSIAREFLDAQGNPALLQVWVNTVLGETWEEQGEAVSAHILKSHVETYGPADLPDGVHYATAGVDTQGDRLEVEVVGWGEADETWGIQYEIIPGDPAQPHVWHKLDELLLERFWTASGRLVRIRAACVDSGGHHAAQVLNFCRARINRNIYPIKGASGPRPIWPKRASKSTNTKENVWLVGVDTAKDAVYGRWRIAKPGPGYCHLPPDYDDDWYEQATSEMVVTRYKDGRPYRVWIVLTGRRNEALDCRVYATAARMSLGAGQTKPSRVEAPDPNDRQRLESQASTLAKATLAASQRSQPPVRRGRRMRSMGI